MSVCCPVTRRGDYPDATNLFSSARGCRTCSIRECPSGAQASCSLSWGGDSRRARISPGQTGSSPENDRIMVIAKSSCSLLALVLASQVQAKGRRFAPISKNPSPSTLQRHRSHACGVRTGRLAQLVRGGFSDRFRSEISIECVELLLTSFSVRSLLLARKCRRVGSIGGFRRRAGWISSCVGRSIVICQPGGGHFERR